MTPILNAKDTRGVSPELWARKFSHELIVFTHKQWTHRNGVVHYSPSENMTVSEHEAIDDQLQSYSASHQMTCYPTIGTSSQKTSQT
jgi:hypothetical protein